MTNKEIKGNMYENEKIIADILADHISQAMKIKSGGKSYFEFERIKQESAQEVIDNCE